MNPYNVKESIEYKTIKNQQAKNLELFVKKNHDYGDSFFKTWNKMGEEAIVGAYSRISDKYNRLEHYVLSLRHQERLMVEDESIMDTLIDLSNYCLMTAVAIQLSKSERGANAKPRMETPQGLNYNTEGTVFFDNNYTEGGNMEGNKTQNTPNPSTRVEIPRRNTNGNF